MDVSAFREALRAGLGRAILYARNHDVRAFQDAILDACLHCYSVDPQCEGTRAPYMLDLINLTPNPEFYSSEVLKALSAGGDDWDAVQRFRFTCYRAMDGDVRSKQAVYEAFDPGPKMAEEICIDFIRMDGLEGFLFAAEKMGTLITANSSDVPEGRLWSHAIETFGEEQTLNALRKAGENNKRVEAYRVFAQANRENRDNRLSMWKEIKNLSYQELKPKLPGLRGTLLGTWGEQSSPQNLE
jgi:hypothetical protein